MKVKISPPELTFKFQISNFKLNIVVYLQVENLTKSFGDRLLFENISFGIDKGQRVALIASQGANLKIVALSPTAATFVWVASPETPIFNRV